MPDFRDCYAVLEVSPDTEWAALRAHYKRLISQWHPDRFAANSDERHLAEERIKRITAAYKALEKYRREYGVLPFLPPAAALNDAQAPTHGSGPGSDRAPSGSGNDAGTSSTIERQRPSRTRRRRLALAVAFLVVMLYFAHDYLGDPATEDDHRFNTVLERDNPPPPEHADGRGAGAQDVISVGSTLGDVFAIQGVPTRAQGQTWHYGKSHINFSHGKVVSWAEDPDFPLRIARNQPVRVREGTFQVGSTKDEVRSIQGAPVTETATVWDYGLSRVYFEEDRVIRWQESPVQPLRVLR